MTEGGFPARFDKRHRWPLIFPKMPSLNPPATLFR